MRDYRLLPPDEQKPEENKDEEVLNACVVGSIGGVAITTALNFTFAPTANWNNLPMYAVLDTAFGGAIGFGMNLIRDCIYSKFRQGRALAYCSPRALAYNFGAAAIGGLTTYGIKAAAIACGYADSELHTNIIATSGGTLAVALLNYSLFRRHSHLPRPTNNNHPVLAATRLTIQ